MTLQSWSMHEGHSHCTRTNLTVNLVVLTTPFGLGYLTMEYKIIKPCKIHYWIGPDTRFSSGDTVPKTTGQKCILNPSLHFLTSLQVTSPLQIIILTGQDHNREACNRCQKRQVGSCSQKYANSKRCQKHMTCQHSASQLQTSIYTEIAQFGMDVV